ncbi:MAG: YitT family protein [Bacilli bacterium]|nr:YitT family protein [Bacilli bacterium]
MKLQLKKYLNKKRIKEFLIINLGVLLISITFTFFLDKNNFIFGGVSGIGVILKNVFGEKVPSSFILLVVNLVLLLIGLIFLGKSFFFKTIYGTVMYPVYSFLLEQIIPENLYPVFEGDTFIIVLGAGLIMGAGLGLTIRYGASTGGVDILQLIGLRYFKIPLSVSLVFIDGAIILIGALTNFSSLPPVLLVLYGITYVVISGIVMDNIVFGGFNVRAAYVVTNKCEEMKQEIYRKLNRGVTEIYSRGGYSNEDNKTLLCVLTTREYYFLRSIALEIDPHAFVFVTKASEVHGEGFTYEHNERKSPNN